MDPTGLSDRTARPTWAIEELFATYRRRIYMYCLRLLGGDAAAAEDAVSATFLAAWRGLPRLRDPDAIEFWLMRIARREAQRQMRPACETVVAEVPDWGAGSTSPIDALIERADARAMIEAAMPALEVDNQELLRLLLQDNNPLRRGPTTSRPTHYKSSSATAHAVRRLTAPRGYLYQAIVTAYMLWTNGGGCLTMAAVLQEAGRQASPTLRKRVTAHVAVCSACTPPRQPIRIMLAIIVVKPVTIFAAWAIWPA